MKKLIYRILFFLAIYKIGYYVGSFSTVNELKERTFTFILNNKDNVSDLKGYDYIFYGNSNKNKFEREFSKIENSEPMYKYYKLHLDPKFAQSK